MRGDDLEVFLGGRSGQSNLGLSSPTFEEDGEKHDDAGDEKHEAKCGDDGIEDGEHVLVDEVFA